MATKEEQETLRLLVQHVSRAFYEPKYTIILDQLARHPVLKDDDLAGRMGLQAKELNKLIAVLHEHRLVQIYRQNELKEGAQRAVGKQYYYIDYQHFCNVVKWRVAEMRRIIDSTLRNELDNKGWVCPQCHASYTPLDADKLMDRFTGLFLCEICQAEVVDNENAESVRGGQDRMKRFNKQMQFVREGLRKTEAMVLPAFDVPLWVKNNPTDGDKKTASQSGGLKIAGSGPKVEDAGIAVMMSMDKDEATRKMERDAEAEAKRVQNALPAWHLKSTITGDLTALGVVENARAEAAEAAAAVSNDELLKGLGTVGTPHVEKTVTVVEDVKPVVNVESDYYDQYYASLAASTTASAQATPSNLNFPAGDDFGDDFEEDRKPSIEYLNSLNDYRKRSRSMEDVGEGRNKAAKLGDSFGNGNGFTNGGDFPVVTGTEANGHTEAYEVEVVMSDDPLVFVNGVPIPFSQVDEQHQEEMTPEEYTVYFEVLQSRS